MTVSLRDSPLSKEFEVAQPSELAKSWRSDPDARFPLIGSLILSTGTQVSVDSTVLTYTTVRWEYSRSPTLSQEALSSFKVFLRDNLI